MNDEGAERTLPLSDAGRIDALREDFERAWQAGTAPRIEEYVSRVGESTRYAAFRELLGVEIKLRRSRSEVVKLEDYVGRFPAFAATIRDAWSNEDQKAGAHAPGGGRRSGLHVRCPHCLNPIELVPDAELESLRCGSCGSNFSLTSDEDDATRDARSFAQVGHFKLVERLGMGAFGTVWKAQDTELDRTVAVKIPRSGQLDKQRQDFFFREARSAAQLRHPNIVPVFEVGRDGDTLYIVSEFVRGITLADRLTAGPLTAREAAQMCVVIADALHHAHEQGVIHRDLKPANILLDGADEPHLMDFGLARRDAHEITMTLEGQVLGTPAYMSPEQAQGDAHAADRRSDVYSLGVMLFEMLTGELPFRGNARMMIHQVIHDEPPNPRKLNSSIPKDLDTVTMKCLEKAPTRRFHTVRDLGEELGRYLRGEPIRARPISRAEGAWRWCHRKPMHAAVVALVLVIAIAGPIAAIRESSLRHAAQQNERLAQDAQRESESATATLREQTAKYWFAHGNAEYAAGKMENGSEEVFRAWMLCSDDSPLKSSYERVLVDRLTRGLRSFFEFQTVRTFFSPSGLRILEFGKSTLQLRDATTGQPIGEPIPYDGSTSGFSFSPDGTRLIVDSRTGAQLLDAETGREISLPMHLVDPLDDVEFSPDGSRIFTNSWEGKTAQLWDAITGAAIGESMRHVDSVFSSKFSSDGTRLLTLTSAGRIQVWDATTGQPIGPPVQFEEHFGSGNVAFSPDGKHIHAVLDVFNPSNRMMEPKARLWDVVTGRPNDQPVGLESDLTSLVFSRDGKLILSRLKDNTGCQLWDAALGTQVGEALHHTARYLKFEFSPDGTRILTASQDDKNALLWDAATGKPIGDPMQHGAGVIAIAFSPDGRWVVTSSDDRTVRVWDAVSAELVGPVMRAANNPPRVQFSPNGSILTESNDGAMATARLWEAETGQPIAEPMHHGDDVNAVAFSPDAKWILTGSQDGIARLWNVATGLITGNPIRHDGTIMSVAFSPNGERILTGSMDYTARLWDAATRKPIGEPMRHKKGVSCAAFSPDGKQVLTESLDNTTRLWDAFTGQAIGEPVKYENDVSDVSFSADGKRILTGSLNDRFVQVRDAATGETIGEPMPHTDRVHSAIFSPDGRLILTGTADGAAWLWNAATGKLVGEPMRHEGAIWSVAFSPDGNRVITGSWDGTARQWDAGTGQPIGEPLRHNEPVISAVFSPDGKRILTGSNDNTACLWDATPLPLPRENLAWFELLLGKKLDDAGQFVSLTSEEVVGRWKILEQDPSWIQRIREFHNRRARVAPSAIAAR